MKTLVICSDGLDAVTLAHRVAGERTLTHLVSFNYGQHRGKKLDSARACAARLGVPHDIVDTSAAERLLAGSALASSRVLRRRFSARPE